MNDTSRFHLKTHHVLLLILCLGFLLRIINLEVTGLWMDEIHSAVGTDPDITVSEVLEYCKKDQPPVFFLLLHGWFELFEFNDFNGRFFVLLTSLPGIISMYFLGKELKNSKVGLIAAFLTAINYFHVDHSRQIRFYPLVFLFSSLSYLFFIRIFKHKRPVDFVFYTLSTAALLNTHYFGIVVFVSQFILFVFIILWKKIKDIKFISYSLLSGVFAALSFAHWLPVVFSDLGISQFHIQPVTWYFPIQYYYFYFRDFVTCFLCAALSFLVLREIFLRMRSKITKIDDVILLGWIGLGFLIPLLYSVLKIPMLEYKYTFIVVPAIIMMVALGFETDLFNQLTFVRADKLKIYLVAILFFAFLNNALFIKTIYFVRYPPQQWREVTREVMKTDAKNQIVFSEYAWYFRYYFKVYRSFNPPLEPKYADFNALISNADSVWVLTSTSFYDEGLSAEQQKSLDEKFRLADKKSFNDTIAKHYIRR